MKAEIAVLIMLIMALIFPALSSVWQNEIGQGGLAEHQNSRLSINSVDTKRLEERMTGALADMISQSDSANGGKGGYSGSITSRSNISDPFNPGFCNTNLSGNSTSIAGTSINSSATNASAINITANSTSINSSAANASATLASAGNPSVPKSPTPAEGGSVGQQEIGSSSNSKFNGYYGIASSQHQMGKNNIDSSTFLSGSFSMEKSVKFQDRGF